MTSSPRSPGTVVILGDVPEPVGGVGEVNVQLCTELDRRGVAVHFIDTEPDPQKHPPPLRSYRVIRTREPATITSLAAAPWSLRSISAVREAVRLAEWNASATVLNQASRAALLARRHGANAIFAHHAGIRGLAAVIAGRAVGIPATVMVHGSEIAHPGWQDRGTLVRHVLDHADRIIVPSDYTAGLCTEAADPKRVDVVPNGVDHDRFHPGLRRHPPGGGEDFTVLFVGHLHPRKGPATLAEAIPRIRADRPTRFVFAGPDRGEADRIRQITADAGVADRTEILGMVPADDLPRLYGSADVMVFPTVWGTEGFGLVAAEAMACGTPVVASRVGAIPEVVLDGIAGLLVTPGDVAALADSVTTLLGDPERLASLGAAASEHASGFTWDGLADAVIDDLAVGRDESGT